MKSNHFFLATLLGGCLTAAAQPIVDSWHTENSGRYARVYPSDEAVAQGPSAMITTWNQGAGVQSDPVYSGIHGIWRDDTWVYVRSSGLASYPMGPWYFGASRTAILNNFPANTATLYRLPLTPPLPPATKTLTEVGITGYFVDGVAMFNFDDTFSFSTADGVDGVPRNGLTGDGIWRRDALPNEGPTFDAGNAHPAGRLYHYHVNPTGLRFLLGDNVNYNATLNSYSEAAAPTKHSPILGWAADGYPLYGPYGHSTAGDSNSPLRRMTSGYRKRNTSVRQSLPAWAARYHGFSAGGTAEHPLAANQFGPNVDATFPIGQYIEDYEYLGDVGLSQIVNFDLDLHNGRICVTPEFPAGTYAYFMTIEADGTPAFPYLMGEAYYGEPTGSTVTSVPGTAAKIFSGGPEAQAKLSNPAINGSDVTLVWDGAQGGSYRLETSEDLQTWTLLSINAMAADNRFTVAQNGAGQSLQKFYRTIGTNVATFDTNGFDFTIGTGGGNTGTNNNTNTGPTGPVTVMFGFATNNTPPVPAISVIPSLITIGGQTATFVSRPGRFLGEATFDPAGLAPGDYPILVTMEAFAGAIIYTATNVFTVTNSVMPPPPTNSPSSGNILLLIVDDWAIDSSGLYNTNMAVSQPPTPTIDALAANGVLFRNGYAQPTCSPTRATMITGQHPFRHGVGAPVTPTELLTAAAFTLPEAFAANPGAGYNLASFGKWHLNADVNSPNTVGGWPHFSGSLGGGVGDYYNWRKTVNGVNTQGVMEYATTNTVNDTISWIQLQGTNRWFAWVGFNAGHTPFHKPPTNLHSYPNLSDTPTGAERRPAYEAAIESIDTEIARMLSSVDTNNTTIIILGDNGTPEGVAQPPFSFDRSKGTIYEGGTHVPFIISGAAVVNPGRTSDALVHCVDIYSTVLDLAGINASNTVPAGTVIDSRSIYPLLRQEPSNLTGFVFCETFGTNADPVKAGKAIRDPRFKLLRFDSDGHEEFYDLEADPAEQVNLLAGPLTAGQQNFYNILLAELNARQ
jgi:arylsulfatase A-like enzyme